MVRAVRCAHPGLQCKVRAGLSPQGDAREAAITIRATSQLPSFTYQERMMIANRAQNFLFLTAAWTIGLLSICTMASADDKAAASYGSVVTSPIRMDADRQMDASRHLTGVPRVRAGEARNAGHGCVRGRRLHDADPGAGRGSEREGSLPRRPAGTHAAQARRRSSAGESRYRRASLRGSDSAPTRPSST